MNKKTSLFISCPAGTDQAQIKATGPVGISSSCLLRQMPAFWPPVSRKSVKGSLRGLPQ